MGKVLLIGFLGLFILVLVKSFNGNETNNTNQTEKTISPINHNGQSLQQTEPNDIEENPICLKVHEILRQAGYLVVDEGTDALISRVEWRNERSGFRITGWTEGSGSGMFYRRLTKLKMTKGTQPGWEAVRVAVRNGVLRIHDGNEWVVAEISKSLKELRDELTENLDSIVRSGVEIALRNMELPKEQEEKINMDIEFFSDWLSKSNKIICRMTYKELLAEFKKVASYDKAKILADLQLPDTFLSTTPGEQKELIRCKKKADNYESLTDKEVEAMQNLLRKLSK
jgi:hypothetical protein